jgi:hypothetical protein
VDGHEYYFLRASQHEAIQRAVTSAETAEQARAAILALAVTYPQRFPACTLGTLEYVANEYFADLF